MQIGAAYHKSFQKYTLVDFGNRNRRDLLCLVFTDNLEHIEDTNSPDDYSLTTITDENIIKMDIGALGGPNKTTGILGNGITFSAEKFTGVYEILYDHFIFPSDFDLSLCFFPVDGGNFKLVVVHDDQIVAVLEPGMFVDYRLDDVTGTVSLRIAGESASSSFHMTRLDYDYHSDTD